MMIAAGAGIRSSLARSVRITRVSDPSTWDQAIDKLGGSLLQCWQWGEFKAHHGWSPFRLLGTREGVPVIAAQVLKRSVGPMSVFYVPRGPASKTSDSSAFAALTVAIDALASEHRAVIAFLEPEEVIAGFPAQGALAWSPSPVELQPPRTIKVRVDREDDDILAGMKSKSRYNVRLAGRRGVTVRIGDLTEVAPFYEILEETSQRDAFGIHGVEYYADMLQSFGDRAVLLLAELGGRIAAGAIVLQHGDEAIYMFGASAREFQRHMPTHLLQFEAMRWARERGCTWYDLWGIPADDTPPEEAESGDLNIRSGLWGVYRFKQGFGGEVVSYPGVYERKYSPALVGLWRRFRSGPGA